MKVDIFNTDKKYNIIYADPPWEYKNTQMNFQNYKMCGKKYSNSVKEHYPTMTFEELNLLPINQLADTKSCLLYMWATSPNLDIAIKLGESWGFKYKTVAFVWEKQRTNYGFYSLSSCELCLVFKMGKIPPRQVTNVRQFLSQKLGRHSEKPKEIMERIDKMFSNLPRIELFARQQVDGWDCWGNEV